MPQLVSDLAPFLLALLLGSAGLAFRLHVPHRLALRRLARGRAVRIPARIGGPGATVKGRLVRAGDEMHLLGKGIHWVVPVAELRGAPARGVVDSEEGGLGRAHALTGPDGAPGVVEVDDRWSGPLDALLAPTAASTEPSGPLPLRRLLAPGLVGSALLFAGASAFFGIVRAAAVERTSPVTRVTELDGLSSCHVQWTEGTQLLSGAPDCPDPIPAVGDPMTYLTPPWPFHGQAWDLIGGTVLVVAPLVVAALLAGWAVVGALRLRRRQPVLHRAVAPVGEPALTRERLTILALVDRAARLLRWEAEPLKKLDATGPRWRRDALRALAAAPRGLVMTAVPALLLAWAFEWPDPVVLGIGAAVAASALWALARAVGIFRRLRRTWSAPVVGEWVHRAVRMPDGDWATLLFLDETPQWSVAMYGRPPLAGTARVRGDLSDGGSVHLLMDGEVWVPVSWAFALDHEDLDEIRDMLTFQLTGEPTPVD